VPDLALRRPTADDAGAIASICNAVTREYYGTGDANEEEVRSWFSMPDLEYFAAERDGRLVGYADVRRDEDGAKFPVDVRVAPSARGQGVAQVLLERAEEWARTNARPDAVVRGYASERDREVVTALEEAGYRLIRHSFVMHIDLPEEPPPPAWPEGIAVRTYDPDHDLQAVYDCTEEAFADHWDFSPTPLERWRSFMFRESFDPGLWWLAEQDGELAGVCLNAWHFSGDPTFGWVGTLAVRRPWRRRGLGLAFLRHSFADFKERGATQVGLGVDAENTTGAVRLYERAGMRPARRNDTYEKPL
jgi:mycothiol synthase